ncbi:hypothetical protein [Micromonospora sp. NPDC005324]|uniref:hypothetical protein n=1 Tax=Micromonospora sp. NPDC005324 TaxID=3157033 RepID=UPI0033AF3BEA
MSGTLLGQQTPRLELRPECVTSAACEAIEFYHSLGRTLDPWQQHVIEAGLGEDAAGDWAAPEVGVIVQRQNGKGDIAQAVELASLFLFGDEVIVHTAHLIDTSKTAFRRTVELVDGSDDLVRRVRRVNKTNGEEAIELLTGGQLRFRTRTGRAGRGITGDKVFFDEALELTDDQLEALVPTILARPNPQIWYLSTVPKVAEQFLVRLRKRVLAREPGLAYCEWGVDRGANLGDPRVMAKANPAYGIRVTPKTLAIAKGALGEEGYGRECAGIWPPEADAKYLVIPELAWLGQRDASSTMAGRPAYGVYVPPDRSYSAITAAGARAGGGWLVETTGNEHGLDHRPGTGWIVDRLKELERHQPLVVVIDDKAIADAAEKAGLKVHRAATADVVTGCQLLFDGVAGEDLASRNVWHLGQTELTTAVAGADKRRVGNSWAWDRSDPTVDIATLAAGSLALFGAVTPRVHRPSRKPFAAFV